MKKSLLIPMIVAFALTAIVIFIEARRQVMDIRSRARGPYSGTYEQWKPSNQNWLNNYINRRDRRTR